MKVKCLSVHGLPNPKVVIFTITQKCAGMGSSDSRTPNRPPQCVEANHDAPECRVTITQIEMPSWDRNEQRARNCDADSL